MPQQYNPEEISESAIIIDAATNVPAQSRLSKKEFLGLLKKYGVNTEFLQRENPDMPPEDIIPFLRKAKIILPEEFFKEVASSLGLLFLDSGQIRNLYEDKHKSKLVAAVPYPLVAKYKIIPLEVNGSSINLAVDNPLDAKVMVTVQYLFAAWKINLRVASTSAIEWAIDAIYREIHKNTAMLGLYNRTPDQSAHKVLYPKQKYFIVSAFAAIALAAVVNAMVTFIVLFAAITIGYFTLNPIKIYISILGFRGPRKRTRITKGELYWVQDEDLPVYTVLIPVFRESRILAQNMRNMYRLNYPKDKMDVKILMEEQDEETVNEAKLLGLFGSPQKRVEGIPEEEYTDFLKIFDPAVIPAAKVTTKPRACNYGLLRAKGELCVIYDAEDNPDPDQLKKAAVVFLRSDQNVVCLQSKLNFYNAEENILTRWFSIEYYNWYEFYLQGLDLVDAPVPLGGTSNHFRRSGLDELGRWDPYNVTEDADLGLRLARQKLKTQIIDSTTLEEATISVKAWIKQRSRWYKGHLQTFLVHMRQPGKLYKDLGFKRFLKLQLTFGLGVFIPVINPILWVVLAASFFLSFGWLVPSYIMPLCIFNLVVGNLSYLAIYVASCVRLKKYRHIPYALTMPVYWVLHSVASWRGLIQLISNPFYWDKTSHGVSKSVKPH